MPEAEQDSSSDTLTQTGSSFQNEIWKIWTLPMAVFRSLLVSESWGAGGGQPGRGTSPLLQGQKEGASSIQQAPTRTISCHLRRQAAPRLLSCAGYFCG